MKKKITPPMMESEKQQKPLAGEVSPEEARMKGAVFAALEKAKLAGSKK